jgi:ABC-type sulfate/molybdate transport systems ATPase subunit
MIKLTNLGVKKDRWILKGIDLDVPNGMILGVIGRSGAGKSTLLRAIAGLTDHHEGDIIAGGLTIKGPSLKLVPGFDEVQLVDQDFALDPYHTVEENLRERVLNLTLQERDEKVEEMLHLLELEDIRSLKATLISGGEKQRLAIGRALLTEPKVLLLDEPFVHLDTRIRLKIERYIADLKNRNDMTIVIVSHNGEELLSVAERVLHIEDGTIRRIDDTLNLYYKPDDKRQGELLGLLNKLSVNGEAHLFRPNQYELDPNGEHRGEIIERINTGLLVLHKVKVGDGNDRVMLSSPHPIEQNTIIFDIVKWEK